jgi:tetratricopeptide (TPR) repeat protein
MLAELDKAKAGVPLVRSDITAAQETKENSVAVVNFSNISAWAKRTFPKPSNISRRPSAWIFLLRGLYKEAGEALDQAVAIEESGKTGSVRFVGALTLMGNLYLRQGQLGPARSWYQRSLALLEGVDHVYREPFKSLTYCGLGTLYFNQGRHDAQAHYDIACYYALLNRKQETLENLRRAVALGWHDGPALQAEELFAAFRRAPSFVKIIEKLKRPAPLS